MIRVCTSTEIKLKFKKKEPLIGLLLGYRRVMMMTFQYGMCISQDMLVFFRAHVRV